MLFSFEMLAPTTSQLRIGSKSDSLDGYCQDSSRAIQEENKNVTRKKSTEKMFAYHYISAIIKSRFMN